MSEPRSEYEKAMDKVEDADAAVERSSDMEDVYVGTGLAATGAAVASGAAGVATAPTGAGAAVGGAGAVVAGSAALAAGGQYMSQRGTTDAAMDASVRAKQEANEAAMAEGLPLPFPGTEQEIRDEVEYQARPYQTDPLRALEDEPETAAAIAATVVGGPVAGIVAHEVVENWDTIEQGASDAYDYTAETAEAAYDYTAETAEAAYDYTAETAEAAYDYTAETAEAAYDTVAEGVSDAADAVGEAWDAVDLNPFDDE